VRRRTDGNKNKGLVGMKPLAPNLISKTSVQTTAYSKRQFALILPSTSTSLITRQTTLQRDCNPDKHPSNNTTNRATPMRYQSIIARLYRQRYIMRGAIIVISATDQTRVSDLTERRGC
jgi:hypothetical protein